MTDVEDRVLPVLRYRQFWKDLFVIAGLFSTLSWTGALGLVLIGGGIPAVLALLMLAAAAAAAAWAFMTRRRYRKAPAPTDVGSEPMNKHIRSSGHRNARNGSSAAILLCFTAALCWLGALAVLGDGGDGTFAVLTGLPLISAIAACFTFRRWKGSLLHRAR
ncbi:hypothetical protein IV500_17615 [Paeniglutamicibacter antarcticus]|uniref:Uncharacterized protein n=1 Tax=Arthrobacter terrae TaxID=2935737 RepID=A0A931CWG9_9MICC|nr:hypothetical protein [Arthrobacter terrae]MBG0741188.1 hypothetical protein [Arthrobacter terrae]